MLRETRPPISRINRCSHEQDEPCDDTATNRVNWIPSIGHDYWLGQHRLIKGASANHDANRRDRIFRRNVSRAPLVILLSHVAFPSRYVRGADGGGRIGVATTRLTSRSEPPADGRTSRGLLAGIGPDQKAGTREACALRVHRILNGQRTRGFTINLRRKAIVPFHSRVRRGQIRAFLWRARQTVQP